MTLLDPPTTTHRVLAGVGTSSRLDLAAHLATHGELALPGKKGASAWRHHVRGELERSGLRGRGGGGFPTALKLAALPETRRRPTMVINAMEGEPAASKDTVLACYAPHLVLDGAEVLATIVDATSIVVCVARDNPAAARSLQQAIAERAARGRTPFTITLETPPARYVAGEESALSHWLDGGASLPTFRAEKPSRLVIKGRTGVIDNAETAAHAALIARHGADWFRSTGDGGTMLTTISGAVSDPGVFEVALGTPLRDVLALAGARPPVALLLGGYGGTFVGPEALDAPYSPEGLRPFGGSVGAGVIVVFDETTCGLDELARITRWMARESAGQCGPCVFGLPALAGDLERLASARPSPRGDRQLLDHLDQIEGRGACAHPDGVVRMVRSGLTVFTDDVATHRGGHHCPGHGAPSLLALPANEGDLEWR